MAYKKLIPLLTSNRPGKPLGYKEVTVYEGDETSSDEMTCHAKMQKRIRNYKPLIETIDLFSSYKIVRFMGYRQALACAANIKIVKESQWTSCVYYMFNDLDRLPSLPGMHIPDSRFMITSRDNCEPATLGDWLKANTTGDAMTPLRTFLQCIHERWIGPDREYVGYEMRIFTDKWKAEPYPPDWHMDETDAARSAAGILDPSPMCVVTALTGPGTLFMVDRQLCWMNYCQLEEYHPMAETQQLATGELALYLPAADGIGDPPDEMLAAIHARPDNEDGERLVVQMMLCTKRQMKGLVKEHERAIKRGRQIRLRKEKEKAK